MRTPFMIAILSAALLSGCGSRSDLGCSGFNLTDWRSHQGDISGAKALAKCDALKGKSQRDVIRILGRPTGGVYQTRRGTQVSYEMGSDFLGDSTGFLTVRIGPERRVTRVDFTSRY